VNALSKLIEWCFLVVFELILEEIQQIFLASEEFSFLSKKKETKVLFLLTVFYLEMRFSRSHIQVSTCTKINYQLLGTI
jgi:hypothetical protein